MLSGPAAAAIQAGAFGNLAGLASHGATVAVMESRLLELFGAAGNFTSADALAVISSFEAGRFERPIYLNANLDAFIVPADLAQIPGDWIQYNVTREYLNNITGQTRTVYHQAFSKTALTAGQLAAEFNKWSQQPEEPNETLLAITGPDNRVWVPESDAKVISVYGPAS